MKYLFTLLLLLLLSGCSGKKFYTLGDSLEIKSRHNFNKSIDIVKVKVPKYLQENKVVRQVTPYEVELVKQSDWLIPMQKRLTQMLIDYLQQSMNNPNIHLYPWESDNKALFRVSVDIHKFIASKNSVKLQANYKIVNFESKQTELKSFEKELPTNGSMESMMRVMQEAYTLLMEEIQLSILNNK